MGYAPLAEGVKRGFATAGTDTGHEGGSASFATGHPEKLTDFAYRAVHEMTVTIESHHPEFLRQRAALFLLGGVHRRKAGITEAQRYPDDFDGIVPARPQTTRPICKPGPSGWLRKWIRLPTATFRPIIWRSCIKRCSTRAMRKTV